MFNDKNVLVTGGTGSFGKFFVDFLLKQTLAKKVIVLSRDEMKQAELAKKFKKFEQRLRFFIGDVRDKERLKKAFRDVDIVIHAAALKQVPALEYNPFEAIKTNVNGTQNVIDACIEGKVERAVLISTDKAVHPVNLYGASKLCAEKLFISGNSYSGVKCKFSVVRYGNVLGSRGSIVEILLKKEANEEVYVTHKDMTRFWINLKQARDLVLYALKNMEGGEIFIPKAPSMKLVDLFGILAPYCPQKIVGIRPGEKLHEILVTEQEAMHSFDIGDYYVILPEFLDQEKYKKYYMHGNKLPDNFRYTSDANTEWLTKEKLMNLLNLYDILRTPENRK